MFIFYVLIIYESIRMTIFIINTVNSKEEYTLSLDI